MSAEVSKPLRCRLRGVQAAWCLLHLATECVNRDATFVDIRILLVACCDPWKWEKKRPIYFLLHMTVHDECYNKYAD
jgi:hypothetical protein